MTRGELVTVRGGGIFGLSCGWELLRRGARVRIVAPRGIASGSSGGTVGALAPHAPEKWTPVKQFQLESLLMAEAYWAGVAQAGGTDPGYARTGRIQPVADAAALARAQERAAGAHRHWGTAALWELRAATDFAPFAPESETGQVIFDSLSARIAPRRACHALAAALHARGAEIVTEAPEDGAVLHATGWEGLGALSEALGRPMGGGVKGQAAVLRHDAGARAPQIYADSLHIVPHADGTVAIGSTSERDFDDPTSTDAALDALILRARAICPVLNGAEVIDRWAGVRPRAKTRAPMLGHWPDRPGHFIANGGFKIGFGMAPKIAEVMADLILGAQDRIPEGFRVADSL